MGELGGKCCAVSCCMRMRDLTGWTLVGVDGAICFDVTLDDPGKAVGQNAAGAGWGRPDTIGAGVAVY